MPLLQKKLLCSQKARKNLPIFSQIRAKSSGDKTAVCPFPCRFPDFVSILPKRPAEKQKRTAGLRGKFFLRKKL